MANLHPYLRFDGNCAEAFEFYRSVFGTEFVAINRYSEMPPEAGVSAEDADRVMHVSLPIADDRVLMGSDGPPGAPATTFGDSVAVMVAADSTEEGRRIFEALAVGGTVAQPFERQFWGDDFGALVDRFGINWMVDHTPPAG
jgi:PhnB protein